MPTYNPCPPSSHEYCFNGGECFYLSEDPSVYICSCFMPFYGPQCEHEAPTVGATSPIITTVSYTDLEITARRSVDRAMTITALVFIVITFLGLILLAWYLSRRRQKDYSQWKRIDQQSHSEHKMPRQTVDKGVQVASDDIVNQRISVRQSKASIFDEQLEPADLSDTQMRPTSELFLTVPIESKERDTHEQEQRKQKVEEVFQQLETTNTHQSRDEDSICESEGSVKFNEVDSMKFEMNANATEDQKEQAKFNSTHKPSTASEDNGAVEILAKEKSYTKSASQLPDAKLQAALDELAHMDLEENETYGTTDLPSEMTVELKHAKKETTPKTLDSVTTSNVPGKTRSPVTVDRATRQAISEQYKLGLKRISPSIKPQIGDVNRHYHTLTHVGRSSINSPNLEPISTTYVNAIEVTDLVAYSHGLRAEGYPEDRLSPRIHPYTLAPPAEELMLCKTPCRMHTLPRAPVSPLWIETHPVDSVPTPIQEPFTVASQHDALLSELYNRGSVEPLVPTGENLR